MLDEKRRIYISRFLIPPRPRGCPRCDRATNRPAPAGVARQPPCKSGRRRPLVSVARLPSSPARPPVSTTAESLWGGSARSTAPPFPSQVRHGHRCRRERLHQNKPPTHGGPADGRQRV